MQPRGNISLKNLTPHETRVLDLMRKYPEIVSDRSAREKVASEIGITEKTLRNRIADLKRYGMITQSRENRIYDDYPPLIDYLGTILRWKMIIIVIVFFSSCSVALYSLVMPITYISSAELIPSEYETGGNIFSALQTSIMGIQLGRGSTEIFH